MTFVPFCEEVWVGRGDEWDKEREREGMREEERKDGGEAGSKKNSLLLSS